MRKFESYCFGRADVLYVDKANACAYHGRTRSTRRLGSDILGRKSFLEKEMP